MRYSDMAEPDPAPVLSEIADGICTITLNVPDRKNSLSPELVDQVCELLQAGATDDDVRVIVLTNAGTTFCAGADLKSTQPGAGNPGKHSFVDLCRMIQQSPKPVIGRIDGHATGGGVGLAAACDISVMRDDAKIGFTEVRIGVAPAIISVVCLPKMRRADAAELFLTGERISPERATEVGLINKAVPGEYLDGAVDGFVQKIMKGGPNALAASKELINKVPDMSEDDAYAWTAELSARLFTLPEAQDGIQAFRDRTPAPWISSSDATSAD